jgi:tRNA dimethylallyltransferase
MSSKSISDSKFLILIGGPTASGKTALAIELAQAFGTEILSADSRQFYREMSIGTARPSPSELATVKHHFIADRSVETPLNVGDFEKEALEVLGRIFEHNNVAVMVGGTGLYLKAICEGLDIFPEVPTQTRAYFDDLLAEQGIETLQALLAQVDPVYYEEVDIHNPMRLIRALSVWEASGQPFSSFRKQTTVKRSFQPLFITLSLPRAVLYARIEARVTRMMAAGLEEEAQALYPLRHLQALQTVGYAEIFDFMEGNYTSLGEAVDKIKQHSRNYAKRQATWFRKNNLWRHFEPTDTEGILSFLKERMEKI